MDERNPQGSWNGNERRHPIPVAAVSVVVAPLSKEDVKDAVNSAMERHLSSDSHAFVKTLIEKEARRQEMWSKVKTSILTWGVLALLGYMVVVFWQDFLYNLKRVLP